MEFDKVIKEMRRAGIYPLSEFAIITGCYVEEMIEEYHEREGKIYRIFILASCMPLSETRKKHNEVRPTYLTKLICCEMCRSDNFVYW